MNSEPVLIMAAVNAAIALGVGFGLPVTSAQGALINAFVTTLIALFLRSKVTPAK